MFFVKIDMPLMPLSPRRSAKEWSPWKYCSSGRPWMALEREDLVHRMIEFEENPYRYRYALKAPGNTET